jgi:hypothetical protein
LDDDGDQKMEFDDGGDDEFHSAHDSSQDSKDKYEHEMFRECNQAFSYDRQFLLRGPVI